MKLKQLSLFLENKPGNVRKACRTLADNNINIETMALADTEQFGILRILVKDWQRAKEVFEKNGVIVRVSDVVALAVGHRPGGLADILDTLDAEGLNIEYMYGFFQQLGHPPVPDAKDSAIIVFRFDDPDTAIKKLQERKVRIIGNSELFS
ncbi:amino acid-binding protein [Planctomycetales bacterium]|nr:amino acid-binding protein [Planctomycetales bacterium]